MPKSRWQHDIIVMDLSFSTRSATWILAVSLAEPSGTHQYPNDGEKTLVVPSGISYLNEIGFTALQVSYLVSCFFVGHLL
jgi:hypothetical protein